LFVLGIGSLIDGSCAFTGREFAEQKSLFPGERGLGRQLTDQHTELSPGQTVVVAPEIEKIDSVEPM
jgi:hypothetical protein